MPAALFQSALLLAELWNDLPRAICTVTSQPAKAAGLTDRGKIAIGKRVDLTVFKKNRKVWSHAIGLMSWQGNFFTEVATLQNQYRAIYFRKSSRTSFLHAKKYETIFRIA